MFCLLRLIWFRLSRGILLVEEDSLSAAIILILKYNNINIVVQLYTVQLYL